MGLVRGRQAGPWGIGCRVQGFMAGKVSGLTAGVLELNPKP